LVSEIRNRKTRKNNSVSKSEDEIRHHAREEWNAAAPGWKKYRKDMLQWLEPVSDQLMKSSQISRGQTVLDVATGTGQPALTIAEKIVGPTGRVIGVDLSPEMLEVAKEEAAYQGLTNVVFQIVEDEGLSMFSDDTFDTVVCRNGLMFMPDPVKALKAFCRVLKPGGKASVTVWGSPDKSPVMAAVMKTISKHVTDLKLLPSAVAPSGNPGGAYSISSVDMLRDYFLKAGFSNFNAEKIEVTVAQTDTVEQLWQGMTEVTGFLVILLSKLPDEKKLAIKNDVIESLGKMFSSGDPVKLTGELILGTATKSAQ
jgi:ubiquinone/menaquinone biosynthesis C-methylase UbiE